MNQFWRKFWIDPFFALNSLILRISAIALAMILLLYSAGVVWQTWELKQTIDHAAVTTPATVLALIPGYHNAIKYEYFVGDARYEGLAPKSSNPGLTEGSTAVFHYNPANPGKGYLGNPPNYYMNILLLLAFVLTAASLLLLRLKKT